MAGAAIILRKSSISVADDPSPGKGLKNRRQFLFAKVSRDVVVAGRS